MECNIKILGKRNLFSVFDKGLQGPTQVRVDSEKQKGQLVSDHQGLLPFRSANSEDLEIHRFGSRYF